MKDLDKIQKLVGAITADDLKKVDCYVCDLLGIFVPSTGYCRYAVTEEHTHPGYMFNIFPMRKQRVIKQNIPLQENEFLACVVSPNLPHSEKEEEDFHRYYAVMIEKAYFEELFCRYKNEEIPFFVWNQFGVGSDLLILLKQFIREYEDQTENSSQILNAYAEIITHKLIRSLLGLETHQKFASCMNNVIEAE